MKYLHASIIMLILLLGGCKKNDSTIELKEQVNANKSSKENPIKKSNKRSTIIIESISMVIDHLDTSGSFIKLTYPENYGSKFKMLKKELNFLDANATKFKCSNYRIFKCKTDNTGKFNQLLDVDKIEGNKFHINTKNEKKNYSFAEIAQDYIFYDRIINKERGAVVQAIIALDKDTSKNPDFFEGPDSTYDIIKFKENEKTFGQYNVIDEQNGYYLLWDLIESELSGWVEHNYVHIINSNVTYYPTNNTELTKEVGADSAFSIVNDVYRDSLENVFGSVDFESVPGRYVNSFYENVGLMKTIDQTQTKNNDRVAFFLNWPSWLHKEIKVWYLIDGSRSTRDLIKFKESLQQALFSMGVGDYESFVYHYRDVEEVSESVTIKYSEDTFYETDPFRDVGEPLFNAISELKTKRKLSRDDLNLIFVLTDAGDNSREAKVRSDYIKNFCKKNNMYMNLITTSENHINNLDERAKSENWGVRYNKSVVNPTDEQRLNPYKSSYDELLGYSVWDEKEKIAINDSNIKSAVESFLDRMLNPHEYPNDGLSKFIVGGLRTNNNKRQIWGKSVFQIKNLDAYERRIIFPQSVILALNKEITNFTDYDVYAYLIHNFFYKIIPGDSGKSIIEKIEFELGISRGANDATDRMRIAFLNILLGIGNHRYELNENFNKLIRHKVDQINSGDGYFLNCEKLESNSIQSNNNKQHQNRVSYITFKFSDLFKRLEE